MKKNKEFSKKNKIKDYWRRTFVCSFYLICALILWHHGELKAEEKKQKEVNLNQEESYDKEFLDSEEKFNETKVESDFHSLETNEGAKPPTETVPVSSELESENLKLGPETAEAQMQEDTAHSSAEDSSVEVIPRNQDVIVLNQKKYLSYKERRTNHGFLFQIESENLYFHDYLSKYDQKTYEELWGQEDVNLAGVSLAYKFNFMLGSLSLGASYGYGEIKDDRTGLERDIIVDKTMGSINFYLDNMMSEPYIVPYLGLSLFRINSKEKIVPLEQTFETSSDLGNALTIGILVQLNWIEPESAKEIYLNNGVENTYLNIFFSKYENPNNENEPSVQSDFNWGAGLRVEF